MLAGPANHARPDGSGAFPSVAALARYPGRSERTVRSCLDRLQAEDIISADDPGIAAARIKRADRRPEGWDLYLSLVRGDLEGADIAAVEDQIPGLGVNLRRGLSAGQRRRLSPPVAAAWQRAGRPLSKVIAQVRVPALQMVGIDGRAASLGLNGGLTGRRMLPRKRFTQVVSDSAQNTSGTRHCRSIVVVLLASLI